MSNVAQSTLSDIRDGKSYTVRKLADANCWMTTNLALELSTSKSYDVVVNSTGELYGTKWTPTSCASNGACAMNGNTKYESATGQWYYTWYAATAGSGTASMSGQNAQRSICPKNWRLPQDASNGAAYTYKRLMDAYELQDGTSNIVDKLETFPISFIRAGYVYPTFKDDKTGRIWSATSSPANSSAARYFYFDTNYIQIQNGNDKASGFNVRCVAV